MLTVGVKKVIVDDVTAVDEESEIKSKYLNISLLKTDLNIEKGFPCTVYRYWYVCNIEHTCCCTGRHGCGHCDYVSQVCIG